MNDIVFPFHNSVDELQNIGQSIWVHTDSSTFSEWHMAYTKEENCFLKIDIIYNFYLYIIIHLIQQTEKKSLMFYSLSRNFEILFFFLQIRLNN